MRRGKLGWRAANMRYNALTRALAQKAAESVRREREALADAVCPDGASCKESRCVAGRAAALAGADWRTVLSIVQGRP